AFLRSRRLPRGDDPARVLRARVHRLARAAHHPNGGGASRRRGQTARVAPGKETLMATKRTEVTMINSVGEHVAGTKVKLDPETADRFILRGYAEGALSREYSEDERAAIQGESQRVNV